MDKRMARRIAERATELLKPLEQELGVVVSSKGGSYSREGSLVIKMEFAEVRDGVTMTSEATRLVELGSSYGLPEDCLGKKFTDGRGGEWVLTGMTQRSAKYPFLGRKVMAGGALSTVYRLTSQSVQTGFGIRKDGSPL